MYLLLLANYYAILCLFYLHPSLVKMCELTLVLLIMSSTGCLVSTIDSLGSSSGHPQPLELPKHSLNVSEHGKETQLWP